MQDQLLKFRDQVKEAEQTNLERQQALKQLQQENEALRTQQLLLTQAPN